MEKIKIILIIATILIILVILISLGINIFVKSYSKSRIEQQYSKEMADAILILGCQVKPDGSLSSMLQDRLKGAELYKKGVAKKIIVTGDHGKEDYDEVNAMKNYLIEQGIPSENIFMDHAGFSTYESMYRAKYIFETKKVVAVTQEYHLYRTIYIGNQLGIETYGVPANPNDYVGQTGREVREYLAIAKDFVKCIIKPEPTYLGEVIPVSGNGDITNDKI